MERTINLQDEVHIRTLADGTAFTIDTTKLPDRLVGTLFAVGLVTMMNNTFNGGGKDRSDAEREAAMTKKRDAWYAGELNVRGTGGGSLTGAAREAYITEQVAAHGTTEKEVEKRMKETVSAAFGDKESATFPTFLKALAKALARKGKGKADEIEAKLVAKYDRLGTELLASRAKAAKDIDLTDIELDFD